MENNVTIQEEAEYEAAVQPSVINIMMDLQTRYNLPIEIVCGEELQELRVVKLTITGYDETTLSWFVNVAVNLEVLRSGATFDEAEEL